MVWHTTSRHERGYGKEWDKLRKQILERDSHLCQCKRCKVSGRVTIATEVDHIMSKAKAKALGWSQARIDHPSNLQSINKDCHKIKTIEESGGKPKSKKTIGEDGWPVETI